jgi:hypothetical protein
MADQEMHFPGVQNVASHPAILAEKTETTRMKKKDQHTIFFFIKALRKGLMKR